MTGGLTERGSLDGAVHRLVPGEVLTDIVEPYRQVDRRPPAGRCWVLANMVGGLDGSASVGGNVGPLSDARDRQLFRGLRSLADVVVVGAATVRRERYGPVVLSDPARAARQAAGRRPVPPLAVVSRSLDLDWDAPVFTAADAGAPTIVVTCMGADPVRRDRAAAVADVVVAGDGRVDLDAMFSVFAERGLPVVLCEGGPTLLGEVAALDLLDELCLTVAPVIGGDPLPVSVAPADAPLRRFHLAHTVTAEGLLYLRYERAPRGPGRGAVPAS